MPPAKRLAKRDAQRKKRFTDTTVFSQRKSDKDDKEVNDKDTDLVGWVSHNLFASVFPESFFSPMYLKRNR